MVTNSGDLNATIRYYYDGQKIIETGDGSGNLYQQLIHGTQYIDELVMIRVTDKGDLYVHQDANWNVIGLTDLGGSLVERYAYTPYGELTVYEETGYGDRDGDGDVDSTDKGTVGTTCTGTVSGACRVLDLDFDGDYDSTDATNFDSLPQGLSRHPGRIATSVHQPFAHQGLLYEPEVGQYQSRGRQYDARGRFLQRDPFAFLCSLFIASRQYPDVLNSYAFVAGNPVVATDPMGLARGCYTCWYAAGGCSGYIIRCRNCVRGCALVSCIGTGCVGGFITMDPKCLPCWCPDMSSCAPPPGGTNGGNYECVDTPGGGTNCFPSSSC